MAFPHNQMNGGISLPQPLSGTGNGTLARRDADGRRDGKQSKDKDVAPSAQRRQSKRKRGRRSRGKERGKSASGSAQKRRTLRSAAGKSATLENPARFLALPIVTRRAKTTGLVRVSAWSGLSGGQRPMRFEYRRKRILISHAPDGDATNVKDEG